MKKRIFYGTFGTCGAVIMVCMLIISGIFYHYYAANQRENLNTEFSYLYHMVQKHGLEHLYSLDTSTRIAYADSSGKLLIEGEEVASSDIPFASREEFTSAQTGEVGSSSKLLNLTAKQICVFEKLSDGSVICLYSTHNTYLSLLLTLCPYIIVIILVSAPISVFLSRKLSHSILSPINNINLQNPGKSCVYPELLPLVDKINTQNEQLQKHIENISNEHELQDKMRREFTANVSHELKTPLTSISGYAEIMRDGLVQEEDIRKFAGKIHDESQRMIALVGDIIKLSQLDENEIAVKIERINLKECCKVVIGNLEHQAKKKNVTVTLEGDEAVINGAEVIIEEIIHNICDNAIKYNKENGSVRVKIRQCIDGVELSVKDTGIGIPEEDLEHVFERFYRVDKSHSKEIGGTGLGLSIVKHGAKFHNASVSVESKLNSGTTVRLLF